VGLLPDRGRRVRCGGRRARRWRRGSVPELAGSIPPPPIHARSFIFSAKSTVEDKAKDKVRGGNKQHPRPARAALRVGSVSHDAGASLSRPCTSPNGRARGLHPSLSQPTHPPTPPVPQISEDDKKKAMEAMKEAQEWVEENSDAEADDYKGPPQGAGGRGAAQIAKVGFVSRPCCVGFAPACACRGLPRPGQPSRQASTFRRGAARAPPLTRRHPRCHAASPPAALPGRGGPGGPSGGEGRRARGPRRAVRPLGYELSGPATRALLDTRRRPLRLSVFGTLSESSFRSVWPTPLCVAPRSRHVGGAPGCAAVCVPPVALARRPAPRPQRSIARTSVAPRSPFFSRP